MRRTLLDTLLIFCAAFTATAIVVIAPAAAETLSDPESGLTVTLPPGYSAFGIQHAKDKGTAGIYLNSNIGSESCDIIYSKSKIDDSPQYDSIAQNWSDRFDKYSVREMAVIGARPLISDTPNFDKDYPLRPPVRPLHGRMLSAVFKTTNAYLHVSCNSADMDFHKLRPMLDSLVRGISLPN